MLKSEARKFYREKRSALSSTERMKLDDLLLIQFQKVQLPFLEYVLSYWPMEQNHEVSTLAFTGYLEFKNPGLQTVYPKTDFSNLTMQAIIPNDSTSFKKNQYNIYEPEEGEPLPAQLLDLVLVPMLICDLRGHRAGYGKGFYDRYLKNCRHNCIRVGLSYFEPLDSIDDTNEFDVPLNFCITPQKAYVF